MRIKSGLGFIIVCCAMLFGVMSVNAASGSCGNLTWSLSSGTLTISGNGSMDDYYTYSDTPWNSYRSSIKEVVIGDGVTSIGDMAFYYCSNLTEVTLGDKLSSIGEQAFSYCPKLTNITVSKYYNQYYSTVDGVLFNKVQTELVCYPAGKQNTSYTIPSSVKTIKDYAFADCTNLTSITVSNNVTTIGNGAFEWCDSLTSIKLGNSITTIGYDAFRYCEGLKTVTIPDKVVVIGDDAFYNCKNITEVIIGRNVATIGSGAFRYCEGLKTITIPSSVTLIESFAFDECTRISTVNYNGDVTAWNKIDIESYNWYLNYGTKNYFFYANLIYENGIKVEKKVIAGKPIDDSLIDSKKGNSSILYLNQEKTNVFIKTTPVTSNVTLYVGYEPNQYTYRFVDENGVVLKECVVVYGTEIVAPEAPIKQPTQHYSYTFAEWSGFKNGMSIECDSIFTAVYNTIPNQYTYKFLDNNGNVLKEQTIEYGTSIVPPQSPRDKEPYTFDHWGGYVEGMTISEDITFTAVYKYKNYVIIAEGISEPITATYNCNFVINPQNKEGYNFIGYFTENNGKGNQITNENGESLSPYNVVGNMNVYPYFYSQYVNRIELQGTTSATLGETITQRAIFATDKNAMYLAATIKYPKYLEFRDIKGVDFVEASEEPEKTVDDFKYLDITCLYNYLGDNIPVNTNLVPFEIEFTVATDAEIGNTALAIENVLLSGTTNYNIVDITNHTLEIKAKLAESIEIIGDDSVGKPTQFNAIISPDYATNKSVVWSVDDETVATVSQNGVVTPIKNGSVILTATTQDGSGLSATKTIEISAYARIDSLDFGNGIVLKEFNADVREYIVYVREDATSITLTPTFSGGGVLRANGSGIWVSNSPKDFEVNEEEPAIITLNRENVTDMINSIYTIKVVKFEGTKTTVSEDKKSFAITPINIENGKTVILAFYNGEQFVEMQSAVYTGETVPFTTTKTYTKARVMVWDDITNLKPVCNVEIVK